MKQMVTRTYGKGLYEITKSMQELTKDGDEIVAFQVIEDSIGYTAIVVLKHEYTADEG